MSLKPEVSLMVALTTGAVVYAVYQNATPTIADIRSAPPNDDHIDKSRKSASWLAAGVVAAISLLAKDATVFIVGGAEIVALDWWTRHANVVNPDTGRATVPRSRAAGNSATLAVNDTGI